MKMLGIVILIVALCTCGKNNGPLITGGATETVNAQVVISDTIVTVCIRSDTTVAVHIVISSAAFSPVYNSSFIDSSRLTGRDLRSEFTVIPGTYTITIAEQHSNKSVAFMSIATGVSIQDTLTDTLSEGNLLKGTVTLPAGVDLKINKTVVYLEGTNFWQVLTEPDFYFVNIPDGKYRVIAWVNNTIETGIKSLPLSVSRQVDFTGENSEDTIQLIFSK
jgi:hypothetical protein